MPEIVTMLYASIGDGAPSRQASPVDLVGLEAEKARQALITGAGLKDVIIKCYFQMSLALKQEQGIERKDFMTTGELNNYWSLSEYLMSPFIN